MKNDEMHKKLEEKLLTCPFCEKVFVSKPWLDHHLLACSPQAEAKICEFCGKVTSIRDGREKLFYNSAHRKLCCQDKTINVFYGLKKQLAILQNSDDRMVVVPSVKPFGQ